MIDTNLYFGHHIYIIMANSSRLNSESCAFTCTSAFTTLPFLPSAKKGNCKGVNTDSETLYFL